MKNLLIFTLLGLALQANAQDLNEHIVRLGDQLDSIGVASIEANYSHGLRTEYFITINCDLYNDSPDPISYRDQQGNILSVTSEQDQRIRDHWRRCRESYDMIRFTGRQLAEKGTECYIWESHRGGVDSLLYSVALRDYTSPQDYTPDPAANPEWSKYIGAKEGFILKANPPRVRSGSDLESYKNSRFFPLNEISLTYRLTIEEEDEDTVCYVDYNELAAVIDTVLQTDGVKSHPIKIAHDGGADVSDYRQDIISFDITHPDLAGETHGTVYEIETAALADSLRRLLSTEVGNYVLKHRNMNYLYRPLQDYSGDMRGMFSSNNWLISTESHNRQWYKLDKYLSSRVLLHHIGSKAYVLVLESVNDFWLPKDWDKLKSWKNGVKEFL